MVKFQVTVFYVKSGKGLCQSNIDISITQITAVGNQVRIQTSIIRVLTVELTNGLISKFRCTIKRHKLSMFLTLKAVVPQRLGISLEIPRRCSDVIFTFHFRTIPIIYVSVILLRWLIVCVPNNFRYILYRSVHKNVYESNNLTFN